MGPLHILLAIFGISLLVIVHEGGHYLVARAFGMRVTTFSIGFGTALWKYRPKGSPTTFKICAVPFLAYVQIDGMNPSDHVDPEDAALYPNKSVFARIATIFAGPFANYLAASLIVFGLALSGLPRRIPIEPMTVDRVMDDSPAAAAGVREGDIILEANGEAIANVEELIEATRGRAGQPTVYRIRRGEEELERTITPREQDGRGVIGVSARSRQVYEPVSFGTAVERALVFPLEITVIQLQGIAQLIRQRSTEGITGPVGMGKMMAQSVEEGARVYIFRLMLLSVALGMFNLLPFPALDGGRLMFLGYELVTRRRANERVEAWVHTVGLLFLLGVLVLVTFRDIVS